VLEPVMDPVGNRPVVVERSEDLFDCLQDGVDAPDVEEGLLLAGERRVREIFGGRARADREGALTITAEPFPTPAARMRRPTSASWRTSSTSSASSSALIRASSPVCDMNRRKASAVVAKPSGTLTPAETRLDTISPRDAFFPPTCSRSAIPTSANHLMLLLLM
jgi:hypothetical protein